MAMIVGLRKQHEAMETFLRAMSNGRLFPLMSKGALLDGAPHLDWSTPEIGGDYRVLAKWLLEQFAALEPDVLLSEVVERLKKINSTSIPWLAIFGDGSGYLDRFARVYFDHVSEVIPTLDRHVEPTRESILRCQIEQLKASAADLNAAIVAKEQELKNIS